MTNFDRAMMFVFAWEGGATITRDPDDPGGTTKYGISQRANPDVDVENLTEDQAKAIYRERYWDRAGCGDVDWPMCLAMMDYAVHSGVGKMLDDIDVLAMGVRNRTNHEAAYALTSCRMAYLLELVRRRTALRKYLRGWMNRVSALFAEIRKETA